MTQPTTTETITDQVSADTVKALRAAMERLFAGRPTCTDGRLVKENLYRDAGVSRATMNRVHRISPNGTGARLPPTPAPQAKPDVMMNSRNCVSR
ncbi:hypothetical protein [Streptomyces sp. NPDC053069]|uniref:hypothetical protein n=1 Tax=Streptomyces sp. NPDC053069 TaxID=3365695 RepID=UPI0037CF8E07